jgi:hypothetical protein
MKKILILLFVIYISFINCEHVHSWEEKKQFLELALGKLDEYYKDVPVDCLEKQFSADLNVGVLFTDNFDNDLQNIEKNLSPSVIDYLKNNKDEKGLVEKIEKLDDGSYHKMVIFKALAEEDECLGIMVLEGTISGDIGGEDLVNCPFLYAASEMLSQLDFTELANNDYLVYNFKYSQ